MARGNSSLDKLLLFSSIHREAPSIDAEVVRGTTQIMKETGKGYSQSMKLLLSSHPDLARKYRRAHQKELM